MNKIATLTLTVLMLSTVCHFPAAGSRTSAGSETALSSPQRETVYSGKVIDSRTKEPLIGAGVILRDQRTVGVATDLDGSFSISVPDGVKPVFEVSYINYESTFISPSRTSGIVVELEPSSTLLDEVQVIAYGSQRKVSITGSISSINQEELLKSPSGSIANSLAGALTGISSVQVSGQPGAEDPTIYVRGSSTLNDAASTPLILVDGVERSFFQMDPNEIASITVLKDAASTAVFGVRGANGVILVTTKRGEEGKMQISWSSNFGITQPLRHLKNVSSYEYGLLYNEAQTLDNPSISESGLMFSPYVLELFRTNADPIMFPNTDWDDYIFKDLAWQTQHNITMSGGSKRFRYFVSLGYLYQDGILKRFDMTYNPNYTYNRYNYRGNVDIDITNTTNLKINLGGIVGRKNEPTTYNLWENIMWCTPFSSPGFVDGHYVKSGNEYYIPLQDQDAIDLFYNYGHTVTTSNTLNMDLQLTQKLDFITEGLSVNLKGAYNSVYNVAVTRNPTAAPSTYRTAMYMGYFTQPGMDISNPMYDNTIVYRTSGIDGLDEPESYGTSTWHNRNWYLEGSINYNRTFGDHEVSALLLYNQSKTYYPAEFKEIPTAYVGYVGRITYNYKRKYLVDFNVGYNGSENFAPGMRYGLFPAGSVGWVISEEPWMKGTKGWLDFLKIRASYGLVGNDKYSGSRFLFLNGSWNPYNSIWAWGSSGSWQFGSQYSPNLLYDAAENAVGNPIVSWEKVLKQNYGIDLVLFSQQLNITADVFFEHRYDILSTRNTLPDITAIDLPMMNLGIVDNHGYELTVGWRSKAREFNYWLQGNISFARNTIKYMDEVVPNEPYMAETGRSIGLNYGYVFDRFLTEADFDSEGKLLATDASGKKIPAMSTVSTPRPGDALFKDMNDDGVVNTDDCTFFGYSSRPEYVAGFMAGFEWRGLGFSMQWTGAWNASRMIAGEMREPFGSQNSRSLLTYLAVLAVFLVWFLLRKTRIGLRLRAVGENPKAAESVGISVNKIGYIAFSICGVLCGLSGAFMSMSWVTFFMKNMVNGRGYIGLSAQNMAKGEPVGSALASLLFGFTDALATTLQNQTNFPVEFLEMLPYLATIFAIIITSVIAINKRRKIEQGMAK